ncbi:MAG: hypothetical protein NTW94_07200 [Legionellales bacterium]|nr:hypothetical protein [Legionellales bacterium]
MLFKSVVTVGCGALLACCSFSVFSGPWLAPSEAWESSANLATKSDVTLLSDYGFIQAPILTWPMAWKDIGPSLLSDASEKRLKESPPFVQLTYFRVLSMYRRSMQRAPSAAAYVSGGHDINPFRTFEFQPRSSFQGGASIEQQGDHFASKLALDYGQYQDVTQKVHLDDSYLYGFLGNWALGIDKLNNWWGPGYSSSMILSANPPPLAKMTFRRMQSLPFETKWLSWIGPWSLTTSLSMGGAEVPEPHPLIWLFNLSIRPLESLQFSLSRNSLFAGDDRPLNWRMLGNLLTADDNCDPNIYGQAYCDKNTPGNELWELTADWNLYKTFRVPANLYLQTTFNDRIPSDSFMGVYNAWHAIFPTLNPPIPARTAFLAGTSTWFSVKDQLVRLYAEFEYTHQYAYYFWGELGSNIYGGPYPYVYYDKLIGTPLGSEATGYTLGGILNETNGSSDSVLVRYLRLNQYGMFSDLGYPFNRQDVLWLSLNRSIQLPKNLGKLSGQLAYLQSLSGTGLNSSPSFYVTWTKSL